MSHSYIKMVDSYIEILRFYVKMSHSYIEMSHIIFTERSGSVVECLTWVRRAAGSSLLRGLCIVVIEQDSFIQA